MTKAAALLDALLARRWKRRALRGRVERSSGWAGSDVQIARELERWWPLREHGHALSQRPPSNFLQALRQLGWQHWDPPARDERRLHWLAVLGSFLIHLAFLLLLIWVAVVRWVPHPTHKGDEGRVQLSFVGRGTPEPGDAGPDEPQAPFAASSSAGDAAFSASAGRPRVPTESAAAASAQQLPNAAVLAEPVSTPRVEPLDAPIVDAAPPPPAVVQPLRVTETPQPTIEFVLPPSREVSIEARPLDPATPEVRVRPVELVTERPTLPQVAVRELRMETHAAAPIAVREREITVPERAQVQTRAPPVREFTPTVSAPPIEVKAAELPELAQVEPAQAVLPASPQLAAAPAQATEQVAEARVSAPAVPSAASHPSPRADAKAPTATQPAGNRGNASGTGMTPADRSGGWDSPRRGDDWNAAARAQAGERGAAAGSTGLFNADGSARVPGGSGDGDVPRGAPGGEADSWSRDRIAQSGTWLKRPPYDYSPTSLDRYWVPNESLLQEWVRRGIQQIDIPIPGTSTRITCVVSLLQFGGACGLGNPNMNDQPAQARPPPDIPFKKELQEDNGSMR